MSQSKDLENSDTFDTQEYVGNGFYLTTLSHQDKIYRLGTTNPQFRKDLTSFPMEPSEEDLLALQEKGLWLQEDTQAPHIAITCGGVGSVWPGLGRALYDTFPAARAAMDELANIAQWDILALMDEQDMEKLSRSRWQLPYLFFIEYAQASYLQSLGFKPYMVSGHSLGELISLCIAEVFSLETAWQVFDRRAVYIDGLEQDASRNMGMMAVYGNAEKVQKLLEIFPELYICNHNTPTQYLVGGKKDMLNEAKRALRKEKCPAIVLPINMAFHHPHLNVLRQSALDGLMGLPINAPQIPVMSNVTADVYPSHKEGICEYIADLDENTVRWVDCVRNMWDKYHIRHFVELGSSDNICNLTKEIEPQALCIAVTQKNNEVASMREAVAKLYALGHIPLKTLMSIPQTYGKDFATAPQKKSIKADSKNICLAQEIQDILPILAEATELEVHTLQPHMDLRHDLAIRSNRFPAILYAFEKKFGINVQFEDVMHVSTILDLANVVATLKKQPPIIPSDAQVLPKDSREHILELCFGKNLPTESLQSYSIDSPTLVLGMPQEELVESNALHVAQTAANALEFLQNAQEECASLMVCLPQEAQLRPWNYTKLCSQIAEVTQCFLRKTKSEHKKIFFQAKEHFSNFAALDIPFEFYGDVKLKQKYLPSTAQILQSLYDSTRMISPQENMFAFDNFVLEIPTQAKKDYVFAEGVTREGIIFVQTNRTLQEKSDILITCQSELFLRDISNNSRRAQTYFPLAKVHIPILNSLEKRPLLSLFAEHEPFSGEKITYGKWKEFAKEQALGHNGFSVKSSDLLCACIMLCLKSAFQDAAPRKDFILQSIEQLRLDFEALLALEHKAADEASLIFSWRVNMDNQNHTFILDVQVSDENNNMFLTIKNACFMKVE